MRGDAGAPPRSGGRASPELERLSNGDRPERGSARSVYLCNSPAPGLPGSSSHECPVYCSYRHSSSNSSNAVHVDHSHGPYVSHSQRRVTPSLPDLTVEYSATPCHRCAWQMGNPSAMVQRYTPSHTASTKCSTCHLSKKACTPLTEPYLEKTRAVWREADFSGPASVWTPMGPIRGSL